jgi:hypothetical protein
LDGGQEKPALPGPEVGHVGDPEHVLAIGAEVALDQVIGDPNTGHRDRRAAAFARHQPADAGLAHEPFDALAPDVDVALRVTSPPSWL